MSIKLVGIVLLAALSSAQQPAAKIEFEVASVKAGDPLDPGMSVHSSEGGIVLKNNTLRNILLNAYKLRPDQIEGGPKWMESARFTIDAKLPQGVSRSLMAEALQSLLADRFHLRMHRETRIKPAFALVQGKGGAKLQKASPDEPGHGGFSAGPRKLQGRGVPMSTLVYALAGPAGAPVFDETGLQGEYDFTLEFAAPNWVPMARRSPISSRPFSNSSASSWSPSSGRLTSS